MLDSSPIPNLKNVAPSQAILLDEGVFSEFFLQTHTVNYKNVLIRCHKRKVSDSPSSLMLDAKGNENGRSIVQAKDVQEGPA